MAAGAAGVVNRTLLQCSLSAHLFDWPSNQ